AHPGEGVGLATVALDLLDEALVLEQPQGGVDGSGARAPQVLAALGDLAHQLVAVARLLGQQGQDGVAHVAAPSAPAAATTPSSVVVAEAVPGTVAAGSETAGAGSASAAAVAALLVIDEMVHGWSFTRT